MRRTHYCGAYWRWGFHEDGVWSALQAIRDLGSGAPRRARAARGARGMSTASAQPSTRAGSATAAATPVEHAFRYRGLHALPRPRRAAARARAAPALVRTPRPRPAASAAPTTSATAPCRSQDARARRGRAQTGTRARRPVRLLTTCAPRPLLQPGQLLLLLRRRTASTSRRWSPRSPTRPGASATPTCIGAADGASGGSDKALPRLAVHGDGPALRAGALTEPGETLADPHRARDREGERVFDADAARCERAPLDRAALTRVLVRYPATALRDARARSTRRRCG